MKLCLVCNFQFEDEQELCPKDLSKLVPVGKDPLLGKLIQDKYKIECLVAKGSMGVIYKAVQEHIGREVAIKVMHNYLVSDEESLKRYYKEAKASSRLNHPNIVTIYDFGVLASGQPYIVMDLLQGKALSEVLHDRQQLTLTQVLPLFQQICLALGEAHKQGVFHRDIKPENIVIQELPDGKNIRVKVVDFGIATFATDSDDTLGKITKTGTVCGSPFYMSPEQCEAAGVDARSDLYSLGVLLFECLTSKVPFDSKDVYQVLTMQVKDPPPSLKQVRPDLSFSKELERVVSKTLAKNPDDRFQSAEELWNALALAAGLKPTIPQPAQAPAPTQAPLAEKTNKAPLPPTKQETQAKTVPVIDSEELKKKIKAKTLTMQQEKEATTKPKQKGGVSILDRFVGLLQIIVPPLLTLIATFLLFWVVANEAKLHALMGKAGSMQQNYQEKSIETLMAQNKLDQARKILEKKKKENKLTSQDRENLNWVYIGLARKETKAKHFRQAIALLELGSSDMREQPEVRIMLRRLRKQANKQP